MNATGAMQDWLTLGGVAASDVIVQERQDWVDTTGHEAGTLTIHITDVNGADIILEGCDDLDGCFSKILVQPSASADMIYANLIRSMPVGSGNRLYTYLRWRVAATGGNWRATFRVNLTLK